MCCVPAWTRLQISTWWGGCLLDQMTSFMFTVVSFSLDCYQPSSFWENILSEHFHQLGLGHRHGPCQEQFLWTLSGGGAWRPNQNYLVFFSVLNFPTRQVFNGSFSDQTYSVQTMYRMVMFNCDPFMGYWTILFARPTCFLELSSLVLFSWLIFFPVWFLIKWVNIDF